MVGWGSGGVEFEEDVLEFLNGAAAVFLGDFLAEDEGDAVEELDDLLGSVGLVGAAGEVVGVFAFEEPGGGAPVLFLHGGVAEAFEGFDFEVMFGAGEFGGEVGVAGGGAGDGGWGTADYPGRDASAQAVGDEGDELGASGGVEGLRGGHGSDSFAWCGFECGQKKSPSKGRTGGATQRRALKDTATYAAALRIPVYELPYRMSGLNVNQKSFGKGRGWAQGVGG